MSEEKTIEQEMQEIMDTLELLEERMRTTDIKLSDSELQAVETMKLKLSEYEKSFQRELERHIAAAKEEGLIPKD